MINIRFQQKTSITSVWKTCQDSVWAACDILSPLQQNRMAQWIIPSFSNLYGVVAWMSGAGSRNLCLGCKKIYGGGFQSIRGGPGFKKANFKVDDQ